MADSKQSVDLVSPDGKRTWSTSDRVEVTNLRARGWHEPQPPKSANPKSDK